MSGKRKATKRKSNPQKTPTPSAKRRSSRSSPSKLADTIRMNNKAQSKTVEEEDKTADDDEDDEISEDDPAQQMAQQAPLH